MFKYIFIALVFLTSSFAQAGRYKISQPGKADVYVPTLESDGKTLILQPSFDVTKLSNSQATSMGIKQYLHGSTYNGGNAPTVTLAAGGGTLSTVHLAVFIPYQLQDGTWRLRSNGSVTLSSATRTSVLIEIAGIKFADKGVTGQQVTATQENGGATNYYAFAVKNIGRIEIIHGSLATTYYSWSFDVELLAKPTWAY